MPRQAESSGAAYLVTPPRSGRTWRPSRLREPHGLLLADREVAALAGAAFHPVWPGRNAYRQLI